LRRIWTPATRNAAKPASAKSLNEELLENGRGKLSSSAANLSLGKPMSDAQDRAKAAHLGIWKENQ